MSVKRSSLLQPRAADRARCSVAALPKRECRLYDRCRTVAALRGTAFVKTFEGQRTIDGLVVTVDGAPLDEHYEVKRFTTWGFEWTYEGESPQQLALAILVEHLGDPARALQLSEPFMKAVVANLDNDWVLTGSDIDQALRRIEAAGAGAHRGTPGE